MSKGKFELLFFAGGMMLDVVSNKLRREPSTPREEVGAAAHEVNLAFDAYQHSLEDPDLVRRQIIAIRQELSSSRPRTPLLSAHVQALASEVDDVPELYEAVARLRTAINGYLGD